VHADVMQEPPLATEFLEVPCEVKTAEIEKIGGMLLQYQQCQCCFSALNFV
jgi:hypothetical protein